MGKYIAQSDVEDVFGLDNVCLWSNLDNSTDEPDAVRIERAIAYAEEEIENAFRGSRYAVPFSGALPRVVIDWMAKLAGIWLFESRPKTVGDEEVSYDDMRNAVERDMNKYLSGQRRLSLKQTDGMPSGPAIV